MADNPAYYKPIPKGRYKGWRPRKPQDNQGQLDLFQVIVKQHIKEMRQLLCTE